ncbi:MAG TPA: phage tail tape measure protein [Mycobacteriales bacterium]|nr:phage tail tape measure protein [Mycobacteriales bacterium]
MASRDLTFRFLGQDLGASRTFDKMALQAEGLHTKLSSVQKAIGSGIVLAVGAMAVKSVEAASKFQSSMELIHTQAGASQDEVKKLSGAVLGLAGKTATAPDELAKGLYHLESTGLRGAKAINVLRVAAEGAKVGQADLEDVTNALNAAIASGIPGVQNMQQAMGALNAVVGSGDMRMQDLADALGTGVLAVVKGFGLSLNDVGAALATFGDNNIRGADAATALRMAVMSLAKPAVAGADAIKTLGLQQDTLAKAMQRGGLNAALTVLHDRLIATGFTGNKTGQILTEAFGKKAGIGLQVLEEQFARFQSKVKEVRDGATGFADAWDATTKTLSFRFAQLKDGAEALGIRIGMVLIPVVSKTIQGVTALGSAVGATVRFLDQHKMAVELLAGVLAVRFLPMLAKTIVSFADLARVAVGVKFLEMGAQAKAFAGALTPVNIGVAALVAGAISVAAGWHSVSSKVDEAAASLKGLLDLSSSSDFASFAKQAEQNFQDTTAAASQMYSTLSINPFKNLSTAVNEYSGHLSRSRDQVLAAAQANRQLVGAVEAVTGMMGAAETDSNMQRTFVALQEAMADGAITADDLKGSYSDLTGKLQLYLDGAGGATTSTKTLTDAIQGLENPAETAQQRIDDLTNAIKGLIDAPLGADKALSQFETDLLALRKASDGNTHSISQFTNSGLKNRAMLQSLVGDTSGLINAWAQLPGMTVDKIVPKLRTQEKALLAQVTAFLGSKKAAEQFLGQMGVLPSQLDQLVPKIRRAIADQKNAIDSGLANAAASAEAGGEKVGTSLSDGVLAGISLKKHQVLDSAWQLGFDSATSVKKGAQSRSPSKITIQVGKDIAEGVWVGFDLSSNKVFSKLRKKTQNELTKLQTDVQNARQFRSSMVSSLVGYADITQAPQAGVSVFTFQKAKLNDLKRFAHDLSRLRSMGLNKELLGEIAAAGPAAIPVAEELIRAGRAGIRQANRNERLIDKYSRSAAGTTTQAEYGGRIDADIHKLPHAIAEAIRKNAHFTIYLDGHKVTGRTVAHRRRTG